MLNDLFRIFSDEVQSNVGDLPIFENFEKKTGKIVSKILFLKITREKSLKYQTDLGSVGRKAKPRDPILE